MQTRNIIVIGASAGGFEAIKTITSALPPDFPAAIFIVWHISAEVTGVLPRIINKQKRLPATNAVDKEPVKSGHIYVAPPDRHLILEKGFMRVTRGPKENRFRPAVDPLFRSAAYAYGSRVIGIILSGALDDGTAGLWYIKQRGGLAIVQAPEDAEVPSMPQHAIQEVAVDHVVPVSGIARLLVKLTDEPLPDGVADIQEKDNNEAVRKEIEIAVHEKLPEAGIVFGELTALSCPECHGVLAAMQEGGRLRYRCHTGHAFSESSLLSAITEDIENNLWNTTRGLEESVNLLNHMGDHFAEINQPALAAMYFKKAKDATGFNEQVRKMLHEMDNLDASHIKRETATPVKKQLHSK
ncbi:two-component system chemotaxis response regulator CheB [Chitinophaga sp. W2I13]|uniref:chemotaxis protein CheB n=1 Tax=Chitinophaga sp. W2I13 TaxID=3373923 RepID=UPI003D234356